MLAGGQVPDLLRRAAFGKRVADDEEFLGRHVAAIIACRVFSPVVPFSF